MARLTPRLRRKMSIKKNRHKTPEQQAEDVIKTKPKIKKRTKKKITKVKAKRVYQKKKD